MAASSSTAIQPLSLDPKRNGAFGDAPEGATPAAVVDPTSGQTINTATGQPALDPAQQEATMSAQGDAQAAQLQAQSAEQQAQTAQQQSQLVAQQKDLEIQKAQQAAEATKVELERTKQQIKQQEAQMAESAKSQPTPQLSPAVTNRIKKITGAAKPMDNSALIGMKLAAAPRARGYQGGHDFKTKNLLAGARKTHNAAAPRTATAEEMRPHQTYKGQDWSNYKPRDNADPSDLSGTNGVSYGPGYMDNINAARDRMLAQGGAQAAGVAPAATSPTGTLSPPSTPQPSTLTPAGTGVSEIGAVVNRSPGIYENGQLMVRDPFTRRYVPAPTPQAAPTPTPPAAPAALPNEPVVPGTSAPMFTDAPAPAATLYNPEKGPAMVPYNSPPSTSAAPTPPSTPAGSIPSRQFDRSGSGARLFHPPAQHPIPDSSAVPSIDPFNQPSFGALDGSTLIPPGNPLGLPPAMAPTALGNLNVTDLAQMDPQSQLQMIIQMLGQANSGGYQPLDSLGGGYSKMAATPPKPAAPLPAGPKPKIFDHGDYKFDNPDAAKILANPALPAREQSWAQDQAARHYFDRWGAGSHNQAADYYTSQGNPRLGQAVAERVRGLSNDATRQQHLQNQQHSSPFVELIPGYAPEGETDFWSDTKRKAKMSWGPNIIRAVGDTALGGWKDWTGVGQQELQDQLLPQQPHYGSMSNMTPDQRQEVLAAGQDASAVRQQDSNAWNHRMMGDQQDQGAGLSNTWSSFFEQGALTPPTPGATSPLMNPLKHHWNSFDGTAGKAFAGASMFSGLPLMNAALNSPTVQKHVLGEGQSAIQQGARMVGNAQDAVRNFGEGDWKNGLVETGNSALGALGTYMGSKIFAKGPQFALKNLAPELATRLPFYGLAGADAFQPIASRGKAMDQGTYAGGEAGTAGAAPRGFLTDAFQGSDGVTPPADVQKQMGPTAGESAGGMKAVGDAISNATGAEPGSSTWIQLLTMLLPFLAPLFARMGGQNDGGMASTAQSYYGPEFYGGNT